MRNENLYGWVFVFNPYTQLWNTAKREDYNLLFSATSKNDSRVLKSKNIETLTSIILKTRGVVAKINKLVEGKVKHVIVH